MCAEFVTSIGGRERARENLTRIKGIYWAIHTTSYRVCCIEYTCLFVIAQWYAV